MKSILGFVVATIGLAGIAHAQTPALTKILAECGVAAGTTADDIEKKKASVVERYKPSATNNKQKADGKDRKRTVTGDLSNEQQEALTVLFQANCIASRQKTATLRFAEQRIVEITTYYGTNRTSTGSDVAGILYGVEPEPQFHYGRAVVTIPASHVPSQLELPTLWKLESKPDPNKHFVLKSVSRIDDAAARAELEQKLAASTSRSLLVFVHGYNTTFAEAALRTAQLAHDLKFPGVPLFYSWPSAGSMFKYLYDEDSVQASETSFAAFLKSVYDLKADNIYIVAHSMGNRLVTSVLQSGDFGSNALKEIVLAAPDVNSNYFATKLVAGLRALTGTRTTIYASSNDVALLASRVAHEFRRVGETRGGVQTFPGMVTVDATAIASPLRALGHSYIVDSTTVLNDMSGVIIKRAAESQRGLDKIGQPPSQYWRFP